MLLPTGPLNPQLALEQYRRLAASYDVKTAWLAPYRQQAVAQLCLQPGDTVLDVGCGTGASFPLLEQAIGSRGRVLGLELSPEMLTKAQAWVQANGWRNVTLIQASAEEAQIDTVADAVLFAFTHDILRSQTALENIFQHVRRGGRVSAAGPKWIALPLPLNLAVWLVARQFVTTFEGFTRPWSKLVRFVPDLQVQPAHFGTIYIAWGTVPE